jgi:hypothetical protein
MRMRGVILVVVALLASVAAHAENDPPAYNIACRPHASHLEPARQKELKKRLSESEIRTVALCNYRSSAEVFVELTADPQAAENEHMYKVLFTQLLGIVRKDIVLIDLNSQLKISLTLKHGAAQVEYQNLLP